MTLEGAPRAVAVLVRDRRVLVVHRVRNGVEYLTWPGGGLADGEAAEAGVVRELAEETGLVATVDRHLWTLENRGRTESYFLMVDPGDEPVLSGEELARSSPDNRYEFRWLNVQELESADLRPRDARDKLVCMLAR